MVEFGDQLNIIINCKAIAFNNELKKSNIPEIIETCIGQLSVLVFYDNLALTFEELIAKLKEIENRVPPVDKMVISSKLIEIPVLFHDRWTRECAEDYSRKIKPVEDNCEIVIKYNGLKDLDELIEYVTTPEHWTGNLGWIPGNANAFPLDPRYEIRAPKYNPSRTWTYEGTLGMGTGDKVIYCTRAPGGYQMLGRSPIRVYDPQQKNRVFKKFLVYFEVGDRQKFYSIDEEEYLKIERERDGDYRYRIYPYQLFDVKKYLEFLDDVKEEAEKERKRRPWAKEGF